MNKRTIEILNAIIKYNDLHIDDRRLVIIESRDTGFSSGAKGPYLSFEDLTSEDFFEIYRYKKGLEESKDKKESD
ncbi:hypothetical protein ES705_43014 [subsurface metagenome]